MGGITRLNTIVRLFWGPIRLDVKLFIWVFLIEKELHVQKWDMRHVFILGCVKLVWVGMVKTI